MNAERISITVLETENNEAWIDYRDTGPGLNEPIRYPNRVFEFSISTKADSTGNPIGSGLGLWILDSVVDGYYGNALVRPPGEGYL